MQQELRSSPLVEQLVREFLAGSLESDKVREGLAELGDIWLRESIQHRLGVRMGIRSAECVPALSATLEPSLGVRI